MDEAARSLSGAGSFDELMVRKWKVILELKRQSPVSAADDEIAALAGIRSEAANQAD